MQKIEMSDPKTGKMVTKIEMGDMTIGELLKKIQTNGRSARCDQEECMKLEQDAMLAEADRGWQRLARIHQVL